MINRNIFKLAKLFKQCSSTQNQIVYQFARATQGKIKVQKEKLNEKIQQERKKEAYEKHINEANEFSDQNNIAQNYIINAKNHARLFEVYSHFKDEMNIINYATCLHQIVKLQTDQKYSVVLERYGDEIENICVFLESHISMMKGFTASNFLSNIVKLKLHTPQLIEKIANLIVDNKWQFNTTQTSFMIWSLSHANIRNERYLAYVSKNLQEIRSTIEPQDLANIFMGLGKLKYMDEDLTIYLEAQIYRNSQKFTLNCINMIFTSYEKYYRKNLEVLDSLAGRYMDLGKHLTFRNLSNILVSCSNMNYINQLLLEYIEKQLLRRIKTSIIEENVDVYDDSGSSILDKYTKHAAAYSSEEIDLFKNIIQLNKLENASEVEENKQQTEVKQKQKQENEEELEEEEDDGSFEVLEITSDPKAIQQFQKDYEDQSSYLQIQKEKNNTIIETNRIKQHKHDRVDELDPTNATMILLAYCKMKVIKPELFEVLEANFTNKLDQANPKDVATYSYAHSMLCTELLSQFNDAKNKFLKRSLKNIKKYNHYFYEVVLPFVEVNIDSYNCKQLQVIFTSASKPQVKKRAICRQMISIGLKSIPKLANEKFTNAEERNIFIYKHFKLLTNFAYAEQHRKELVLACYENGIKIDELYKKYSHLLINNNIQNISTQEETEDYSDNARLELVSSKTSKNEQEESLSEEEEDEDNVNDQKTNNVDKITLKKALESN